MPLSVYPPSFCGAFWSKLQTPVQFIPKHIYTYNFDRSSEQQSSKSLGWEAKVLQVDVMVEELFQRPLLDSWPHVISLWQKQHQELAAESKYILPPEDKSPIISGCCLLNGFVTKSSEGHFSILWSQLFLGNGVHGKPVHSMGVNPLVHLFCCEVYFWIDHHKI